MRLDDAILAYEDGKFEECYEEILKFADKGSPRAMQIACMIQMSGILENTSLDQSYNYYIKWRDSSNSAKEGFEIGSMIHQLITEDVISESKIFNIGMALDLIEKAAKQGIVDAKLWLASSYCNRNPYFAKRQILDARPETAHQFRMAGYIYIEIAETKEDWKYVLQLFENSLSLEKEVDCEITYWIAQIKLRGLDGNQDKQMSVNRFQISSELDHKKSKLMFAIMLLYGIGINKNTDKALALIWDVAQSNYRWTMRHWQSHAKYLAGKLLIDLPNQEFRNVKGIDLLRDAALEGDKFAQFELGSLMGIGRLCKKDPIMSAVFILISAMNGNKKAEVEKEKMEKKLETREYWDIKSQMNKLVNEHPSLDASYVPTFMARSIVRDFDEIPYLGLGIE